LKTSSNSYKLHFKSDILEIFHIFLAFKWQSKYISELLHKTQMIGAQPLATPTVSGPRLLAHEGKLLNDPTEYWQVVGALQYCTLTRLDISYAVNQLCQFMHAP